MLTRASAALTTGASADQSHSSTDKLMERPLALTSSSNSRMRHPFVGLYTCREVRGAIGRDRGSLPRAPLRRTKAHGPMTPMWRPNMPPSQSLCSPRSWVSPHDVQENLRRVSCRTVSAPRPRSWSSGCPCVPPAPAASALLGSSLRLAVGLDKKAALHVYKCTKTYRIHYKFMNYTLVQDTSLLP